MPIIPLSVLVAITLQGAAGCAQPSPPANAIPVFASPATYGPPPTGAYLVAILQDLKSRFSALRDVRDVGIDRPVPDSLDPGLFGSAFHGYRVCVAYDPKHRLSAFLGRRTQIYWLRGDDVVHVSEDREGRCGTVPAGVLPPLLSPSQEV